MSIWYLPRTPPEWRNGIRSGLKSLMTLIGGDQKMRSIEHISDGDIDLEGRPRHSDDRSQRHGREAVGYAVVTGLRSAARRKSWAFPPPPSATRPVLPGFSATTSAKACTVVAWRR